MTDNKSKLKAITLSNRKLLKTLHANRKVCSCGETGMIGWRHAVHGTCGDKTMEQIQEISSNTQHQRCVTLVANGTHSGDVDVKETRHGRCVLTISAPRDLPIVRDELQGVHRSRDLRRSQGVRDMKR